LASPQKNTPAIVLVHRLPLRGGTDMRNMQAIRALEPHGLAVFGLKGGRRPPPPDLDGVAWEAWDGELRTASLTGDWLRDPEAHPTDAWFDEQALAAVCALADRTGARLAVVEGLPLRRYIEPLRRRGLRVVLDAHNLEGPLARDLVAGRRDPLSSMIAARWELIEARAFAAADQVWVCSESDAARARELYPGTAPLVVVPNTVPVPSPEDGSERDPATLVYPAMYGYPPNVRAAELLLGEILPALAERLPDVRLQLVGESPTPAMEAAAARDPRVEVTGPVPDVAPYLAKATVLPVPLLQGGGTRIKILEALAARLPVVSTTKGAEGLDLTPGEHFLLADTTDEMVAALARVCLDGALRERLASAGEEVVRERYTQATADAAVAHALERLDPVSWPA
jgi:polysaccharide biosynthesis protein PslH